MFKYESNQKKTDFINHVSDVKTEKNKTGKMSKTAASEEILANEAYELGEDPSYETGATRKMLKGLTDDIVRELSRKAKTRFWLIVGMALYFLGITVLVFCIVFNCKYSNYLKSILLGGFFANLIGLLVIIFKYVFSQSKELYDFWIDIRNGIYHKIDK